MARRRHGFERIGPALDAFAVFQHAVRRIAEVVRSIEPLGFAGGLSRRKGARAEDRRAGLRLEALGGWRMIAMRVGDKDMLHTLAAHGLEQRVDMGFVKR